MHRTVVWKVRTKGHTKSKAKNCMRIKTECAYCGIIIDTVGKVYLDDAEICMECYNFYMGTGNPILELTREEWINLVLGYDGPVAAKCLSGSLMNNKSKFVVLELMT